MKLSIIIPAHNEEENIARVLEKVESTVDLEHELVVVNDHSTDKTAQITKDLEFKFKNIRLVDNTNEKGFANALKFGFSQAKNELVVPVMGDLCDDLNTLKEMAMKMEEGYDVVCGARYVKGGSRIGGSKVKAFFSSFVGLSLHFLTGIPTYDAPNAFKMYRKKVLDSINIEAKGFEISMELVLKAYYAGFKIAEVPTNWKEREKGKSSFKMLNLTPNYLKFYLWGIKKRITG
jgi:glycosyltransferase involved in cell wall biosynthesis